MEFSSILIFAAAIAVATATPGPTLSRWWPVCWRAARRATSSLRWLAWKLWTAAPAAGAEAGAKRTPSWGAVGGGLAVAAANPKTMLFYLALLPNLIDVAAIDAATFLELSGLLAIIYAAVLATYMTAAMRARRLFASAGALRAANRTSSVVMAGTAAFVASRA